ncbi:MAG TPA: sigma-70 family RNA polymerase sigma factor [Polyangiaceae bacterium]
MLEPDSRPLTPEVVARLVQSHREFLAFLGRRLPTREAAEEVLQAAYVRTLEKGNSIEEPENVMAWFYRLLRNSLVDRHRRLERESRALEREAGESQLPSDEELQNQVCACIEQLLPNLKPEYTEILRRVDLEQVPLANAAALLGITTNNATVRLHRARQALKQQLLRSCGTCATHGCLDCSCSDGGCR